MTLVDFTCRVLSKLGITKNHWPVWLLEKGNMLSYNRIHGYSFDLNKATTMTEKIQWYKTRYNMPDQVRYVDKYLFKELIKEKLGGENFTIPLYGAWSNIEDFRRSWDSLPEKFCLKSTLQSDGKCIKVIERSNTNLDELCKEIKSWLKVKNTLINSYCTAYHKATPRILAEKYEESVKDQLYDYKVWCFDGKPYCICASTNHFNDEHYPISYFDLGWNLMDVQSGQHRVEFIPQPKHFEDMIQLSKKLSKDIPFLRVDFFDTDEHLYVAELTFYPGGGFFQYKPESFNKEMGDLFILPNN